MSGNRSVPLVTAISTMLNKSVFQSVTSLSFILRLTKCASEKIHNVLSLTEEARRDACL